MTDKQTLTLIEKLITKTKEQELYWVRYDVSDTQLKPLKTSFIDKPLLSLGASSRSFSSFDSFVCKVGNGFFFLMLCRNVLNNELCLYSQTSDSDYSQIFATTETSNDVNIVSQLKRLYNLIDTSLSTSSIDAFIADFLKNE